MIKLPFSLWLDDEGKKVFKIKQYYTVTVEQYVKAKDRDEAFDIWLEKGGINYDRVNRNLTNEDFENLETTFIDADTPDTKTEYVGTIIKGSEGEIEFDPLVEEVKDENKVVPFNKQFGRHA